MQEAEVLKQNIIESFANSPEHTIELCKRLKKLACEKKDAAMSAFADYYTGASLYRQNRIDEVIELFAARLPDFKGRGCHALEIKIYNLLGLIFGSRRELLTSIDYLLTGIDIAKEHSLYDLCAALYSNMSLLYINIHDYRTACGHLETAISYAEKAYGSSINKQIATYWLNLCCNYINMGDFDSARAMFEKFIRNCDKSMHTGIYYYFIAARLSWHYGERCKTVQLIDKLLDVFEKCRVFIDQVHIYISLCNFLLDIEDYKHLELLFSMIEGKSQLLKMSYFRLELLDVEIRYNKRAGAPGRLRPIYEEYFKLAVGLKQENHEFNAKSIAMLSSLRELEKKQQKLEEQKTLLTRRSEYDALTKLPNRGRLEKALKVSFERARAERQNFCIMLLDIDCFKQYNDTYGHSAGDRALRSVAGVLRQLTDDSVEFFRYGGDEFIGLVYGKTNREVEEFVGKIDGMLEALAIPNAASQRCHFITVTAGFYNGVPDSGSNDTLYINTADMDLYDKKAGWKLH